MPFFVVWGGMREHPIDRFGRAIRPAMIGLAVLAFPVFMFTYGWGLKLILAEVGFAWWVPIMAAHALVIFGVAGLADIRSERRQSREFDQ